MFPLSINAWVIIGLSIIAVFGIGYGRYEHNNYIAFKAKTEAIATIQEAKNDSIAKQQTLVTKGIANEYEAKLSAIKSYYGGLHNASSGSMPSLSNPASVINESASNQLLACASTTQQLVSLQDWINEQIAIK